MKKIIISGATGMIGVSLAQYALEQGYEVLCLVRESSSRINNLPKFVKIMYADLKDFQNINIHDQYDMFYHFAWDKTWGTSRDDIKIQLNNIQYTIDAINLAKRSGCKKFIGGGSQAEYGPVSVPLRTDTPANPQSGYGIAKYTAGKLGKILCDQLKIHFNWVRILSVFGPLDAEHTLIMYTIKELLAGHSLKLTKCDQIWDYLYCDDAARALLDIGNKGINGKNYPLGSGCSSKLSEYLNIIKRTANPNGVLLFGEKEYYPYQPMFLCADISELSKDTGWVPKTNFSEGIQKTIEIYQSIS
ncbi:MAG: NAD(P)-dependent oxidoreductase [Bacteroidales bacterium]|jgi:nucleoside-diphosphate-sugar epimerase|nr:NAD(P)-dependent oxidoreductase [Bacteroidales bacterium]